MSHISTDEAYGMAWAGIDELRPRDQVALAREILERVLENGVSYADFQSAQHTERAIKKASTALRGAAV